VIEKKTNAVEMTAQEKKQTSKDKASSGECFCVYLGPTITGVIQNGTVYRGAKKEVMKSVGAAIEKYPLITSLIVSNKTIAQDRVKVKTPGNILYVNYNKLAHSLKY